MERCASEELLLELRRRIIALRDRRHDTWDDWGGGLDPRGDRPKEASSQHLTEPLPDPDAVCRAVGPRHSSGGQLAHRSEKRFD